VSTPAAAQERPAPGDLTQLARSLSASGPVPGAAQPDAAPPSKPTWDFADGPSLRVGDKLRIDFYAAVQGDFRSYSPEPDSADDQEELGLARIGVEGTLLKFIDYEVKYDFQDDDQPWKDVYANLHVRDAWQVQAGHFKVPYGRERLEGVLRLDFVERTLVSSDLAPGRDTGVMVHGRTKRNGLGYGVGYFWGEPEGRIARIDAPDFEGPEAPNLDPMGPIWAGRVTVRPFRLADHDGWFENLEVGADVMSAELSEGLFSAMGKSLFGPEYFDRIYVKGRRLGIGVDGALETGPFRVQAEYLRDTDDRVNQGLGDETLPDLVADGWWVAGTWVVSGQKKRNADDPRAWFPGRGIGAIEVALRYETLQFQSASTGGEEPDRNPRATNVFPNADTAWTAGVNWYMNRFAKLQLNAIREHIDDIERTPLAGEDTFWAYVLKLQFAM
jgi:phosphate-selective porin OprO/OprP